MDRADPYDVVPYPSVPFPQTHPDRLATIGRLFSLSTADPQRCRYLELGCGSGMNLLCMAALLPEAQFLGIDLAAEPIAIAQRHVAELGLRNLTFIQGDITTIATLRTLGEYDYIVAHGVYSWVPPAVREALLALCTAHLSAHGVAYISYNTLPGCHARQMVREMMRYHVRAIDQPRERLEQGRALLKFIIDAQGGPSTYGPMLSAELDQLDSASPGSVHHDDLAEVNQPFYFHEFVAQAHGHALQYLAEADLEPLDAQSFTPAVREALAQMQDDLIGRQQYLDFLECRRFRQTLLCRAERVLERQTTPLVAVRSLLYSSTATISGPSQDTAGATSTWTCKRGPRIELTTSSASVQAIVQVLTEAWPQMLDFEALRARLAALPGPHPTSEQLAQLLFELGSFRLIDLRSWAIPAAHRLAERPCVNRVVRWQAATGSKVTTLNHVMVAIEGDFVRQLVQLLDGTRTVEQVIDELTQQVQTGSIKAPPQVDISDACAVRSALLASIPASLEGLKRLALIDS